MRTDLQARERLAEPVVPLQARAFHQAAYLAFQQRVTSLGRLSRNISILRLVAFLGALIGPALGVRDNEPAAFWAGGLGAALFLAAIFWHRHVLTREVHAKLRRDIHERHVFRTTREWLSLPTSAADASLEQQGYALDLDVVGPGSLVQRIDTTHTLWGQRALIAWLMQPAPLQVISARQTAVAELSAAGQFREDLEAAARDERLDKKLSGETGFASRSAVRRLGLA